jgi:hypothetical protein
MMSIVNAYIAACEAKATLLNSNIENIRRAAMVACLKAVFCKNLKEELLRELVISNIEPKSYKVHHFLNTRFLKFLAEEEPALLVHRVKKFNNP